MNALPDPSSELVPTWQSWLETAALAAAAVIACALLSGGDPLLLPRGLAWITLAPLLAGLRFGSSYGVACGGAQLVAVAIASRWGIWNAGPTSEIALGWLLAGLIPGMFRDGWIRRLHRLQARTDEQRLRLEGLARSFHALRASHDRLQRETPGSPSTLREALQAFRRELTDRASEESLDSLAARILGLFRDRAFARAATLHWVDDEGGSGPAAASLGATPNDHPGVDEALVRHAARLGEVVSVRDHPEGSAVLAAVPLVDVGGRVHAVVAIRDMPFLALHAETLALLAVLGGHVGDVLARVQPPSSRGLDATSPERSFWSDVSRSMLEARRYGVPTSLAIVELESPATTTLHAERVLARRIATERRLTDEAEVFVSANGEARIAFLLRLADEVGLKSYLARVERLAREEAQELGVRAQIRAIGWPLASSSLPRDPAKLEATLDALLRDGAAAGGAQAPTRNHGVVA